MTNNKPDIDTMKAELEAAGYKITSNLIVHKGAITWDTTWWTGTNAIKEAYAHMQQQRELEALRAFATSMSLVLFGLEANDTEIADSVRFYSKLIKRYYNITDNDDESDDDS